MATIVSFERFSAEAGENSMAVFRVNGTDELMYLENFENGIATLWNAEEDKMSIKANTIFGCFDEQSNFVSELCKIFPSQKPTQLKTIYLKNYDRKVRLEIKKS